jgi:hypothetical protein
MSRKKYHSKKQEKKNIRQAILFVILSIIIVLALFLLGIPFLVKLSIFIGDLRSKGDPITTKDTMPPQTPILQSLPEATQGAQITVSGYTEGGASVEAYVNGIKKKEGVAEKNGRFSLTNLQLKEGKNKIKVKARDRANNESSFSDQQIVELDNEDPELKVEHPEKNTDFFEEDNPIRVSGQTTDANAIYLNDRRLIINQDGSFSTNFELSEGENTLKFEVIDTAGNRTEKEINVYYIP